MRYRSRKQPKNKTPNLRTYIYKVLKQVHPDTKISCLAMNAVKDIVWDMFKRVFKEAMNIAEMYNKKTISSREIQTSVRLELPGELAKHAVSEGTKAIVKSTCGFDKSQAGRRTKMSASNRAGLQFPVGKFRAVMKRTAKFRIGRGAPVYLAAVMEYLTAEILELAGNAARDNRKVRITPRHLMLGIQNDEELNRMTAKGYVVQGGVIPHIHALVLGKPRQFTPKPHVIKPAKKAMPKKKAKPVKKFAAVARNQFSFAAPAF